MRRLLVPLILSLLVSCGGRMVERQDEGDTVAFRHATGITVIRHQGYSEAVLANPWKKGMVLHRYYLVPRDSLRALDDSLFADGTVVLTPLRRAAVFTTVHCALLCDLAVGDRIVGVADVQYIKVPFIQERVKNGLVADCGNGLNPVVEKIMALKPDAILLSPFENSGGYGKTGEMGIPVIECAEYMETTPLGRAEWMRFYGLLFGCEQRADSLFAVVDSSYSALKDGIARQLPATAERPTVLVDKMAGAVWYVPGGRSTIGRMVGDAGGQYLWAADDHSGSLPLPFETVLEKGGNADVWLFRYNGSHDITYGELLSEHRGYSMLRPFRQRRVYGCDVSRSLFYEQTPFRPDYLLSDLLQICYPGHAAGSMRYFKPVKLQ